MPVPESYASRRFGGRDDSSSYSTFSQTRSATRPGFISPSYTSKLSSATLPPRPSFERKLSIEGSSALSRYQAGTRTIPSYGTSSLRSSATPARASTTTALRREVPSVSDRIKSYDTSNGDREFVSRFLKPREPSASVSVTPPKTYGGYVPRDRSGSRDSGFSSSSLLGSSAFPSIGSRERERNVRGNIAARAASIGPSVSSRASRNGHPSITSQSSSEVTPKSSVSSASSSTNASRGVTPPNSNQTASPNVPCVENVLVANEKCSRVKENRNDATSIPIVISTTAVGGDDVDPVVGSGHLVNGHFSHGVNGNDGRGKKGQSVKMITETDSNGNTMSPTAISPCPDDTGEQTSGNFCIEPERGLTRNGDLAGIHGSQKSNPSSASYRKVIVHKISVDNDARNGSAEEYHGNRNGTYKEASSQTDSNNVPENDDNGKQMKSKMAKKDPTFGSEAHASPKFVPTNEKTDRQSPLKEEAGTVTKRGLPDKVKYTGRQQSPSPVRQLVTKSRRTPSPPKESSAIPRHQSVSSISAAILGRKPSDAVGISSEAKRSPSPSAPLSNKSQKPSGVPAASREASISRSPSPLPHSSGGPKVPPLPDLAVLNGKCDVEERSGRRSMKADKEQNNRAGPSRAPQSDSSDNDADSFNTSPTLGGRFRSNRDRNADGAEKDAGLSGLRNIGNTCFMNSVLQCLSNTKPLLEYIVRKGYASDINTATSGMKGALIRAFADLCNQLWRDSKSTVDTSAFKDQIQKFAPRFMGYSQQDAQEFLRYLLEGLHEDINRVDTKPTPILTEIDDSLSDNMKATQSWKRYLRCDDSKIVDLFVGQLKSTLKCTSCGHCSVTFDPFWDLSLPIPSKSGQVRLSQCLELFTKEEILDGDEKPTCSKCATRRKCTKSFTIQRFPKILVIHLKRFSPNERYRGKLSTSVDFPLHGLDMTSYAASRSLGCVYNLYGVANHSGSTYSGHYIAYCKHPYTGEWHEMNDSRVSPISGQNVVSSDGYLLFYELASTSHD